MKKLSQTDKVGLLLAAGHSKKEVAQQLGKSINTIDNQAQMLYRKTGSRNLSDITRFFVRRYTGIPVEDILINAIKDSLILAAVIFGIWAFFQPEILNEVKTSIHNVFYSFRDIV